MCRPADRKAVGPLPLQNNHQGLFPPPGRGAQDKGTNEMAVTIYDKMHNNNNDNDIKIIIMMKEGKPESRGQRRSLGQSCGESPDKICST